MQPVELEPTPVAPALSAGGRQSIFTPSLFTFLICAAVTLAGAVASAWLGPVSGPAAPAGRWPFFVLVASVGMVIALITVARLPAFLALVLAAVAAGLMARVGSLSPIPTLAAAKQPAFHWTLAVELATFELGEMMMKVGLIIALASVVGTYMLESGAADKVVRRCLAVFGEKHAAFALLVGTYIVSIPIFFDIIFMLLIPLAKALRLRTGKDYTLYMLAICCPALITHSMVIPHPGPVAMAGSFDLDQGLTILVGWATGILPLAFGWFVIRFINRRVDLPLVETPGATLSDLQAVMDRREDELPSLWASLAPVLLPVLLISAASFLMPLRVKHPNPAWAYAALEFLGNRHTALFISIAVAAGVLMHKRRMTLRQIGGLANPSIELAAIMILITAAGGAFGLMLEKAHVATAIRDAVAGSRVNLIVLAWGVALVIRIAQGSATVAMLVTAAMMVPLAGTGLPYHKIYLFLAIGYGAMGCSWMNDGGFWVVSKLGGMTERETLKTWTAMTTAISCGGLATVLLLSNVLPFAAK